MPLLLASIPFLLLALLPVLDSRGGWLLGRGGLTLYDWQRIYQLVALAMVLLLSTTIFHGAWPLFAAHGIGFSVLTAVVGAFSARWNLVPWQDAAHEIELVVILMMAFFILRAALQKVNARCQPGMVTLLVSCSALLYLMVFWTDNWEKLVFKGFGDVPINFVAFSNVRFFSDYQAFVIPFLIYGIARYCSSVLSRWAGWMAMFLFCALFYFSGSRSLIFGQLAAHTGLLVMNGRRHLPLMRRHVLAWIGGGGVFLFCTFIVPAFLDTGGVQVQSMMRGDLSLRDVLWLQAWRNIAGSPWLGIGPGEFARQLNPIAAGPHNVVLMIAAEWGIPALCIALAGTTFVLWPAFKRFRWGDFAVDRDFASACWLAFGALATHSLVANVAVIPTSQLCLLLATVLVAEIGSPTSKSSVDACRLTSWSCSVTVIGASILMLFLLVRDIPDLPRRNSVYLKCAKPTPFFSPRFWQQGWLIDGCSASATFGMRWK